MVRDFTRWYAEHKQQLPRFFWQQTTQQHYMSLSGESPGGGLPFRCKALDGYSVQVGGGEREGRGRQEEEAGEDAVRGHSRGLEWTHMTWWKGPAMSGEEGVAEPGDFQEDKVLLGEYITMQGSPAVRAAPHSKQCHRAQGRCLHPCPHCGGAPALPMGWYLQGDGELVLHEGKEDVGRLLEGGWRNAAANPLIAAAGIPIVGSFNETVPMWRSHRDNGSGQDCTHYCMPSAQQVAVLQCCSEGGKGGPWHHYLGTLHASHRLQPLLLYWRLKPACQLSGSVALCRCTCACLPELIPD